MCHTQNTDFYEFWHDTCPPERIPSKKASTTEMAICPATMSAQGVGVERSKSRASSKNSGVLVKDDQTGSGQSFTGNGDIHPVEMWSD